VPVRENPQKSGLGFVSGRLLTRGRLIITQYCRD
jgi:hypothetical protein